MHEYFEGFHEECGGLHNNRHDTLFEERCDQSFTRPMNTFVSAANDLHPLAQPDHFDRTPQRCTLTPLVANMQGDLMRDTTSSTNSGADLHTLTWPQWLKWHASFAAQVVFDMTDSSIHNMHEGLSSLDEEVHEE